MLQKIKNILFSMSLTGALLLLFAALVGFATFIERDYGTETAKALIYNSTLLEIIMILLVVNLAGNIIFYKMYQKKKWGVFLFHLAFIIIFIGAGITRYFGFEGTMHIREGAESSHILSADTYLQASVIAGGEKAEKEKKVFATPVSVKRFNPSFNLNGKSVKIRYLNYLPGVVEKIQESSKGTPYLILVATRQGKSKREVPLTPGNMIQTGNVVFGFETEGSPDILFAAKGENITVHSQDTLWQIDMQTMESTPFMPGDTVPLKILQLYRTKDVLFVVKNYFPSARRVFASTPGAKPGEGKDGIEYAVTVNGTEKNVVVTGGKNIPAKDHIFEIDGVKVNIRYGAKKIPLPFSIYLKDFRMERYPGSHSPASYESFVILKDPRKNIEKEFHIYMNHILNYDGYRFFQSSYDADEKGTILSVNHDFWGTAITYLGYFLMAVGMIASLFIRRGRFRTLARRFSKLQGSAAILVLLFLFSSFSLNAQSLAPEEIPEKEALKFAELQVQSHDGRIKPMHTLCNELVRKITGTSGFTGLEPEQVVLGMIAYPAEWQNVPMIKITHEGYKGLMKYLNTDQKRVPFSMLLDKDMNYRLADAVNEASAKAPQMRNKFDKEVLKVDELVNIAYMIYGQSIFKIFPVKDHPGKLWIAPTQADEYLDDEEALFVKGILGMYADALAQKDWEKADAYLGYIYKYQKNNANGILIDDNKLKLEILYNKLNVNFWLMIAYGMLGFLLLVVQFLALLFPKINIRLINHIAYALMFVFFLAHTAGMGVRWYVSGHAPWSDSYESMVYIAWASILAGIAFGRKSAFVLAATGLLSAIFLSVAMMAWVNPEITPLVPVLKSYWLVIHVAVIISSYGFLGLGAMLALFNLIIINLKTKKNHLRLQKTVDELTVIIEMALIAGLYLLSMGVFLGGIWANESWGRYWGWDAKETWSFVSMLVYAFILHMRFIPGLKSKVAFNIAALWGFATILMTYFGVNFVLTGLHSYASGDGFTIPTSAYAAVYLLLILSGMAIYNERKFKQKPNI